MPNINAIRRAVSRHVDESGVVRDSGIRSEFNITGTIGEVTSLTPPTVELLDGRAIKPAAYVGPVPSVGQLVLVLKVARWAVVVTGIEVL